MSRESKSETPEPFVIAAPEPRRPSGRAILFAGVAGACVLGVGLGLWARPGLHERQAALSHHAAAPAAAPAAARQLEIVVEDRARAPGAPLEVLPPGMAPAAPPAVHAAPPLLAPSRPPEGLIRTNAAPAAPAAHEGASLRALLPGVASALAAARLTLAKFEHPEPASEHGLPAPPDRKIALAKAQAHELQIARADAARAQAHRAALAKAEFEKAQSEKAQAEKAQADRAAAEEAAAEQAEAARQAAQTRKVELAQAAARAAAKVEAHRLALAKLEAHKAATAKAEAARAKLALAAKAISHKLELARQAQADRAAKAEKVRLAKAEARAKAAEREEARLEALADAAEAKQKAQLARLARAKAHAAPSVQLARADRRHGANIRDVQPVSVKTRKHAEPPRLNVPPHPYRARPEPIAPQAGDGLVRVSTSPRCAARDPGAALVCADPALSAAERQLTRAYQGARAAGVPEGDLQRGQQRWLAARSAAAREAPWAVRDVYMARIAELNGQAKEAQGGY